MTDNVAAKLSKETPTSIASNFAPVAKVQQLYEYGANEMIGKEDGHIFYNVIRTRVFSRYDIITAVVDSTLSANISENKIGDFD